MSAKQAMAERLATVLRNEPSHTVITSTLQRSVATDRLATAYPGFMQ